MNKWIDVNERLPEFEVPVLVKYKDSYRVAVCKRLVTIRLFIQYMDYRLYPNDTISHWMPLPPLPER